MSLILDALKKLDREKAFIRKVTANIADEILKPDPVRPRKKIPALFCRRFAYGLSHCGPDLCRDRELGLSGKDGSSRVTKSSGNRPAR